LNFELFIAKRLIRGSVHKSSISAPITKIAVVAIAIGIIMMLVAFATGLGLQEKIREKIAAFNGHITVMSYSSNETQVSLIPVDKNQDFYLDASSLKGVDYIQVFANKYGIIRTETDFEGIVVKGVGTDYNWRYFEDYLVEGRLPNFSDEISTELMLSSYLANRLNFEVGEKVIVYFLDDASAKTPRPIAFDLVGIYTSGFQEFDKTFLIADLLQIQRINKWKQNEVGGFEVFVKDFSKIEEVNYEVYNSIGPYLNSSSIIQQYPSIFDWLSLLDMNIYLIIGIMILVGGINMITALLVLILERTPMIGILKSLGAKDVSIRKLFLYNASFLILRGLFWGNLIGLSLLLIQKYAKVIPLDPETYYVTEAPIYISMGYILVVNFLTILICTLMLIIPTYIVKKISPVKAMRFD